MGNAVSYKVNGAALDTVKKVLGVLTLVLFRCEIAERHPKQMPLVLGSEVLVLGSEVLGSEKIDLAFLAI